MSITQKTSVSQRRLTRTIKTRLMAPSRTAQRSACPPPRVLLLAENCIRRGSNTHTNAGTLTEPRPASFFLSHYEKAMKRSFDASQCDGSPSSGCRLQVRKYFIIASYFGCSRGAFNPPLFFSWNTPSAVFKVALPITESVVEKPDTLWQVYCREYVLLETCRSLESEILWQMCQDICCVFPQTNRLHVTKMSYLFSNVSASFMLVTVFLVIKLKRQSAMKTMPPSEKPLWVASSAECQWPQHQTYLNHCMNWRCGRWFKGTDKPEHCTAPASEYK